MTGKKVKNILLVRPPEAFISAQEITPEHRTHGAVLLPLGILHLGAYLRAQFPEIKVHYLDLHLHYKLALKYQTGPLSLMTLIREKLKAAMDAAKPDVVGVSCALNAFADNFHMTAQMVKEMAPDALVVGGGHYPSSYRERVAADKNVDYVIIGEGEVPFTEFIKEMQAGKFPVKKFIDERKTLQSIDTFPELDYEGLGLEGYFEFEMSSIFGSLGKTLNLLTSRGCPGRCIYCATHNVWDHGFRAQSAENVFKQVKHLKEKYNVQTFMFVDDNFVLDKKRVKQFCRLLIDSNLKINWYPTSVMINALDEEMIHLMGLSGCKSMGLAVETGTVRVQGLIKKNVKLAYAERMAECMRQEGLLVHGLFVLGFPGETKEEIKETIEYARKLKCDWCQFSIAIPLYGTEMYEICRENKYLPETTGLVEMSNIGNITTKEFNAEEMEEIANDANWRVNFLENANYRAGRYEKVLPIFESLARSYTDHFICRYMIWKIHKAQGAVGKADKIYQELRGLYCTKPDYYAGLMKKYALEISFKD